MSSIIARLGRVKRFGRLVSTLVVGGIVLVGALAAWWNLLGPWGIGAAALVGLAVLVAVLSMPETAWQRVTGTHATEELGRLHEEGVRLRQNLPWLSDLQGSQRRLAAAEKQYRDWRDRVYEELPPRWRGVFLTRTTAQRKPVPLYERASRIQDAMDDRLQRLSEIMTAIGRSP